MTLTEQEFSAESSHFYIITAAVLHDKSISNDEKVLFALLTGLSNKYGYCFASNVHLCNQIGMQERTLQRCMEILETRGYIRREIRKDERNKFKTIRRIYIVTDGFKQCLRDDKSDTLGPEQNDTLDPSSLSGIIDNSSCNREERTSEVAKAPSRRVAKGAPPPSPEAREISLSLIKAIRKTKPDIREPRLRDWEVEIDRMLRIDKRKLEAVKRVIDALPSMEFWADKILSATNLRDKFDRLELAIAEKGRKGTSKECTNKELVTQKAKELKDMIKRKGLVVDIGNSYVEFRNLVGSYVQTLSYTEKGFQPQLEGIMRKLGLL